MYHVGTVALSETRISQRHAPGANAGDTHGIPPGVGIETALGVSERYWMSPYWSGMEHSEPLLSILERLDTLEERGSENDLTHEHPPAFPMLE